MRIVLAVIAGHAVGIAWICASLELRADAQEQRLGWYAELAGSCWQGRDAGGKSVDRQCYTLQYGQYLRGTIAIGDQFRGDSVTGWSRSEQRLVMYFWSNAAPRGQYNVSYGGGDLFFEAASSGERALQRSRWIHTSDGAFRVVTQALKAGRWEDGAVTMYERDGNAPAPFGASGAADGGSTTDETFGWFGRLAGACWEGTYPDKSGGDRQCYAWQFPGVLQASAEVRSSGASHQGQAVYLADAAKRTLTYVFWGTGGQFGAGEATWEGTRLLLRQRGSPSRTVWVHGGEGFAVTIERLQKEVWVAQMTVPYARAK